MVSAHLGWLGDLPPDRQRRLAQHALEGLQLAQALKERGDIALLESAVAGAQGPEATLRFAVAQAEHARETARLFDRYADTWEGQAQVLREHLGGGNVDFS